MITVYKYPLYNPITPIELPKGAEILCAKEQCDRVFIWAKVDDENTKEFRTFITVETGSKIDYAPHKLIYVDTMLFNDGAYVVHVFEVI